MNSPESVVWKSCRIAGVVVLVNDELSRELEFALVAVRGSQADARQGATKNGGRIRQCLKGTSQH